MIPLERQAYEKYGLIDLPSCFNKHSGCVKIIGGGRLMWEDLQKAEKFEADTISVNCAGFVLPFPVTHLFSWHHKQISAIKDFRRAEWVDCKAQVHSVKSYNNIDHVWKFNGSKSASGMSAVDLAWLLGYRKIILIGIPMDNSGYFYKASDMVNQNFFDKDRTREVGELKGMYGDALKSMSGNTRACFGEPTETWYDGRINS